MASWGRLGQLEEVLFLQGEHAFPRLRKFWQQIQKRMLSGSLVSKLGACYQLRFLTGDPRTLQYSAGRGHAETPMQGIWARTRHPPTLPRQPARQTQLDQAFHPARTSQASTHRPPPPEPSPGHPLQNAPGAVWDRSASPGHTQTKNKGRSMAGPDALNGTLFMTMLARMVLPKIIRRPCWLGWACRE